MRTLRPYLRLPVNQFLINNLSSAFSIDKLRLYSKHPSDGRSILMGSCQSELENLSKKNEGSPGGSLAESVDGINRVVSELGAESIFTELQILGAVDHIELRLELLPLYQEVLGFFLKYGNPLDLEQFKNHQSHLVAGKIYDYVFSGLFRSLKGLKQRVKPPSLLLLNNQSVPSKFDLDAAIECLREASPREGVVFDDGLNHTKDSLEWLISPDLQASPKEIEIRAEITIWLTFEYAMLFMDHCEEEDQMLTTGQDQDNWTPPENFSNGTDAEQEIHNEFYRDRNNR